VATAAATRGLALRCFTAGRGGVADGWGVVAARTTLVARTAEATIKKDERESTRKPFINLLGTNDTGAVKKHTTGSFRGATGRISHFVAFQLPGQFNYVNFECCRRILLK
jgi:hypothetical protein